MIGCFGDMDPAHGAGIRTMQQWLEIWNSLKKKSRNSHLENFLNTIET